MSTITIPRPAAPASTAAATTARLLAKLRRGVEDAAVVLLSDSTGDATNEWFYLAMQAIAARFPAYTVTYRLWSDGSQAYGSPSTVQTGTGSHTLAIYNCSVSGKWPTYHLVGIDKAVRDVFPDLVMISHGHNDASIATIGEMRDRMLALTESVKSLAPLAGVLQMSQNPNALVDGLVQQRMAEQYALVAQMTGNGWVDILRVFEQAGAVAPGPTTYMLDDRHPNSTGHILWANAILTQAFPDAPVGSAGPWAQQPSLITTPGIQLLTNGDLTSFASPPTLTGWSAQNCTPSKDTTNFESAGGYSVLVASDTAAPSYIYQALNTNILPRYRSRYLTIAARIFVWSSSTNQIQSGRLSVMQNGSAQGSCNGYQRFDGWMWMVFSVLVLSNCTSFEVRLYADSASTGAGKMSVDRVICTPGILPRGVAL